MTLNYPAKAKVAVLNDVRLTKIAEKFVKNAGNNKYTKLSEPRPTMKLIYMRKVRSDL